MLNKDTVTPICNFPILSEDLLSKTKKLVQVIKSWSELNLFYETKQLLYRGSYTSAHILLNLSNELRKSDRMRGLLSILSLFATSLINSIMQELEC